MCGSTPTCSKASTCPLAHLGKPAMRQAAINQSTPEGVLSAYVQATGHNPGSCTGARRAAEAALRFANR